MSDSVPGSPSARDRDDARSSQASQESVPNRLIRVVAHFAAAMTITGLLIRLTLQDSISGPTTVLYYATPPVMLVSGAVICLLFSSWNRQWKQAFAWLVLLSLLVPYWIQHDWRWGKTAARSPSQPDANADSIDVLFWNVARKQDLSEAAAYLRDTKPDVIGLVEVVGAAKHWREFFESELPGYDVTVMGHGMYLLARGSSGEVQVDSLGQNSASRKLRVTMDGREIDVFVVDIESTPWRSREQPLRELADLASRDPDVPTIIVGDFNTPAQSGHFDPLREQFRELFEEVGNGYGPTWPVPLPVHRLDGIWANRLVDPVSCRHGFSSASDHRPVHATVLIE